MNFWTLGNLAQISGGRWIDAPNDAAVIAQGVSTDTRVLSPGSVFVALRGENFDGHDYLGPAFETGAVAAIIDDPGSAGATKNRPCLVVDDTVAALQTLAHAYRDVLAASGTHVVAITGSNGKTTTRHLIHQVLSAPPHRLRGTQSPKSFNNHIGVPLTLLGANVGDDYVAIEIGTNHPGEIVQLSAIVRPDTAVITCVGAAHIGHFGSREAIAREKASISRFIRSDGLLITCGAWNNVAVRGVPDELFDKLPDGVRVIRHGDHANCRYRAWFDDLKHDLPQVIDVFDRQHPQVRDVAHGDTTAPIMRVDLPMLGRHNIVNALSAIAVAREFGVADDAIAWALCRVTDVPGRMQRIRIGFNGRGVTLIQDAYNANPDSTIQACNALASYQAGDGHTPRRVLVLGDMFELGDRSAQLHKEVGQSISEFNRNTDGQGRRIDLVVLIGTHASEHTGGALRAHWSDDHIATFAQWSEDVPDQVAQLLVPSDVVLLKGSRGMQLERIIPAIKARFE